MGLLENKNPFILHNQQLCCWWIGNTRSQGISSLGIDQPSLEYSGFSIRSIWCIFHGFLPEKKITWYLFSSTFYIFMQFISSLQLRTEVLRKTLLYNIVEGGYIVFTLSVCLSVHLPVASTILTGIVFGMEIAPRAYNISYCTSLNMHIMT